MRTDGGSIFKFKLCMIRIIIIKKKTLLNKSISYTFWKIVNFPEHENNVNLKQKITAVAWQLILWTQLIIVQLNTDFDAIIQQT